MLSSTPVRLGLVAAVIVFVVGGCFALSTGREQDKSYSGCLKGTDVFVTLDHGSLDAAKAVTCEQEGIVSDLPDTVTYECMKSQPGIGAGVMQVKWRRQTVLASSMSCEPL